MSELDDDEPLDPAIGKHLAGVALVVLASIVMITGKVMLDSLGPCQGLLGSLVCGAKRKGVTGLFGLFFLGIVIGAVYLGYRASSRPKDRLLYFIPLVPTLLGMIVGDDPFGWWDRAPFAVWLTLAGFLLLSCQSIRSRTATLGGVGASVLVGLVGIFPSAFHMAGIICIVVALLLGFLILESNGLIKPRTEEVED